MHYRTTSTGALLGLLLFVQPAYADHQTVLGAKLSVKDPQPAGAASKRQWSVQGKELSSAAGVTGDPTTSGATISIFTEGTVAGGESYVLPQGVSSEGKPLWKATPTGFVYTDAGGVNGPVRSVRITRSAGGTFMLKAKASAKSDPIGIVPPNLATSACVRLDLGGGDSYHVLFDAGAATIGKNDAKQFRVSAATSEGLCCGLGNSPDCCPVNCPPDACHEGSCDPLVGVCETEARPDGSTCDAGLTNRHTMTCDNGVCETCEPAGICSCASTTQCPLGETCVDGLCSTTHPSCRQDSDCTRGATCSTPPTLTPRFIDNEDGTVTDRKTCLVWEEKDSLDGTQVTCPGGAGCDNPHDADNVYTWDDGSDTRNGTAFTNFLVDLNSSSFAGRSDWRLPWRELQGLVDLSAPGCGSGQPCTVPLFHTDCTPTCSGDDPSCSCTRPFEYWLAGKSPVVNFADGSSYEKSPLAISSTRAVRGCASESMAAVEKECVDTCSAPCGIDGACVLGCDFSRFRDIDRCYGFCNGLAATCLSNCLRGLDCLNWTAEGICTAP